MVVPFEHKAEEIDPQLRLRLRDEYPQILNWMIEGTADWRHHGFITPRSVEAQGSARTPHS